MIEFENSLVIRAWWRTPLIAALREHWLLALLGDSGSIPSIPTVVHNRL